MSDDRGIVYVEGDKAVYRASGLYSCQNAMLLARMGYKGEGAPEWLQQRYRAGYDHEPLILKRLRKDCDFEIGRSQYRVEIPVGAHALIRGHIDGLNMANRFGVSHLDGRELSNWSLGSYEFINTESPTDFGVLDAKALSQSTFESWCRGGFKNMPYYLWQQACYVYGLDAQYFIMAVKNKNTDEFRVEYFSREWLNENLPFSTILGKVMNIESMAMVGESEAFKNQCDPTMFPCPYYSWHPPQEKVKLDIGDELNGGIQQVNVLASKYDRAKRDEASAKSRKEELAREIATLYGGKVASARTDEWTATTYHSTYSAVQWDAIAEKLGISTEEAKEMYTKQIESEKLSVKVTPRKSGEKE